MRVESAESLRSTILIALGIKEPKASGSDNGSGSSTQGGEGNLLSPDYKPPENQSSSSNEDLNTNNNIDEGIKEIGVSDNLITPSSSVGATESKTTKSTDTSSDESSDDESSNESSDSESSEDEKNKEDEPKTLNLEPKETEDNESISDNDSNPKENFNENKLTEGMD